MSALANVREGMQVYSMDDEPLGIVDGIDDEGIRVAGQQVLAGMVAGVDGDRVRINYTRPQFLWQSSPADEKDDAVSYDPSERGELVERIERGELRIEGSELR